MAVKHDWVRLYSDILGIEAMKQAKSDGWVESRCPLPGHEDTKPSFAFNVQHGGFNCQGCGEKGGGVDLFGRLRVSGYIPGDRDCWKEANAEIHKLLGTKTYRAERKKKGDLPDEKEIKETIAALHDPENEEKLKYLLEERRWSLDEIEDLSIGYCKKEDRYWFPVNRDGILFNVRKYKPNDDTNRKLIGIWNRNSACVWPEKALKSDDWIWICEGEGDAVCARSCGINAVAVCTGANTLPKTEIPRFKSKKVIVCYDADKAGRNGAKKLTQALFRHTPELKCIDLAIAAEELNGKKKWSGDFTDWVREGFSVEDLIEWVEELEFYQAVKAPEDDLTLYTPSLGDSINAAYKARRISFSALSVVAMAEAPFFVHVQATCECPAVNSKPICGACPLVSGSQIFKPNLLSNDLLQQIRCTDSQKKKVIQYAIDAKCLLFEITESDLVSLYELIVSESVDAWTVDDIESSITQFEAFAIGDRFRLNQSYEFTGTATSDPRQQRSTLLFTESEPVQDELDTFRLDPSSELTQRLVELFQVPEVDLDLEQAMDELLNE